MFVICLPVVIEVSLIFLHIRKLFEPEENT